MRTKPSTVAGNGSPATTAGRRRVWILNAALATAAVVLLVAESHLHTPSLGVGSASFPVLAALFAAAEILAVHIKFRQDSHSFSLSEIPLVVGLYTVSPDRIALAQVLGGGLVLAVYRRQAPVKLAFNLSLYACSVLCAAPVFRVLIAHGTALGPVGWGAAALATLISSVVGVPAVYLAVTLSDGRPHPKEFIKPTGFAVFVSLLACNMGLAAVEILSTRGFALLLLVFPTLGMYVANRAYVKERERHLSLQFLHDSTSLLHQSADLDLAVDALLTRAKLALRAEIAVLAYRQSESGEIRLGCSGPDGVSDSPAGVDDAMLDEIRQLLEVGSGAVLFESGPPSPAVQHLAGASELHNGILVGLRGETREVGVLLVANHVSEVSCFQDSDVRLLATLAGQLSVALENGRLEHALTQLRMLEGQLTHQATHDPLTGLANRNLFARRLAEALEDPAVVDEVAVLFVDVDDFKTVNDSLGHAVGDDLLVAVSRRIDAVLGEKDLAARLGGDEFAILLHDTGGLTGAAAVAKNLLGSLSKEIYVGGHGVVVNVSVGIALANANCDSDTMMRNADTAMYSAKAGGKGRWVLFSQDIHHAALRRQELIRDMVVGFDENQFEVYFQPIVDLATRQVVAGEALVRWVHPKMGLLTPEVFLPLMEETGHIRRLTRTVLVQACAQAATWPVLDGAVPAVSVNLSARDFENEDLLDLVKDALERTGLAPQRLILEITETLMLGDTAHCIETLEAIASTGVRIALDDFGTGYSSLSYLSHLPLHWVKIAKSFVDDLGNDLNHDALARGIIDLGHLLGLRIVAEGIEQGDQLAALRQFGCDHGQGYLYSEPRKASDFVAWLHSVTQPVERRALTQEPCPVGRT